jgi:hypothetical protein
MSNGENSPATRDHGVSCGAVGLIVSPPLVKGCEEVLNRLVLRPKISLQRTEVGDRKLPVE